MAAALPDPKEKPKTTVVTISSDLHGRVKAYVGRNGMKLQFTVEDWLESKLAEAEALENAPRTLEVVK